MKNLVLLLIIALSPIFSIAQNIQTEKERITQIIRDLPEVKAMDNAFDTITQRVQSVKMNIEDPQGASPYYKVEVGYMGSNHFEIHYYFFIEPSDNTILVEDLKHGDRPLLEEWRRRRVEGFEPENEMLIDQNSSKNENSDIPLNKEKEVEDIY